MKSVGEVMAIGRTFQESLQKALARPGNRRRWLRRASADREEIEMALSEARPERIWYIADAFRIGMSLDEIHRLTAIDPWFLAQIEDLYKKAERIRGQPWPRCHATNCGI
jgi:carbamoyl-phosphate synthase large subunit